VLGAGRVLAGFKICLRCAGHFHGALLLAYLSLLKVNANG